MQVVSLCGSNLIEHLWPTMVMRKWLNIGSKESDYSDDPADDNEDDTESDSDTEEWGRQSRFRDSIVDEAPNEESNGRRTSIACSKQLNNGSLHQQEEEEAAQTPTTKQAIKALTAQIKDMAGKASGAYKNYKPCLGSSNGNKNRKYADSDNGSDSAREIFFFLQILHNYGSSSALSPRHSRQGEQYNC